MLINDNTKCDACKGSGLQFCGACQGKGKYYDSEKEKIKSCEDCHGEGSTGECSACDGTGYDNQAIEEARHNNPHFLIVNKEDDDPQNLKEELEEEFGEIEENNDEFIIPVDPGSEFYPSITAQDIQEQEQLLKDDECTEEDSHKFMCGFREHWDIYKDGTLEKDGAEEANEIINNKYEDILHIRKSEIEKKVKLIRGVPED